jgi:hypothetical protein
MIYFSGFPWNYYTIYSKIVWDCGIYFSEGRLAAMIFMSNDSAYILQIAKWVARGNIWYIYSLI